MTEELHKVIRIEAAKDDVSLNTCIVNLLMEALEARRVSLPIDEHKIERPQSSLN